MGKDAKGANGRRSEPLQDNRAQQKYRTTVRNRLVKSDNHRPAGSTFMFLGSLIFCRVLCAYTDADVKLRRFVNVSALGRSSSPVLPEGTVLVFTFVSLVTF